jgi:hypothetical protein
MKLTPENVMRGQDFEDAEAAWKLYKIAMRNHPRRQLRKRDFIGGYIGGIATERARQMLHVHPNIQRAQHLIDFADMLPEQFEIMKLNNPDLVARLQELL